eukprot:symbB.v1.2.032679.t1/scaffold3957.1/size47491/1
MKKKVEAWSPQAASLLADFGPGLNDGLEEAQVLFGKLASLESGGLKSLTRCVEHPTGRPTHHGGPQSSGRCCDARRGGASTGAETQR